MLTTRAAKWVVKEIGSGQNVSHLARGTRLQLGQREHRHAHLRRGALGGRHQAPQGDDGHWPGRDALRARGPYKQKSWSTTVCDVRTTS